MTPTADDSRLTRRAAQVTRSRPPAPREVQFDSASNYVTWREPVDIKFVTNYRVKVGSTVVGSPGQGQTKFKIQPTTEMIWVTSFNRPNGLDSAPVAAVVVAGTNPDDIVTIDDIPVTY